MVYSFGTERFKRELAEFVSSGPAAMANDLRGIESYTTIFGCTMQHTWTSLFLYERLLVAHPNIGSIVEFGTGPGGLSLYFATFARMHRLGFLTTDAHKDRLQTGGLLNLLDKETAGRIRFIQGDSFDPLFMGSICSKARGATTKESPNVLFVCDADTGAPPRLGKKECIQLCSGHAVSGDIIVGHDYCNEIYDSAIPDGWGKYDPWHSFAQNLISTDSQGKSRGAQLVLCKL